ncbi:diphosphomevalonate decarboxylase [Flaviflexus massiliensis]|uniref:diphosphomevalonate decarboxylase n=1 Tax=Flaviflexus massiliensis TaxID=1522309 RepID=UPI0006D57468|nr:diphosphomevalonate decarboxylase [Flaviflexus massiliensis]
MTVTARAYPNIALVKYWGKADEDLILPVAGSMSMTLDDYPTTTSVTLADTETFNLNGTEQDGAGSARVHTFLGFIRDLAEKQGLPTATAHARVVSVNEGPTAAGMASSASGFAALAVAAAAAYGLDLDTKDLSRLARRGSGSASRSIIDRFAVWHAGDDESSYAEEIQAPDMAMISVPVATGEKAVSSRKGMVATATTSPFYPEWITSTEQILEEMIDACTAGDFTTIGEIAEVHAMRMHAVIAASRPSIRYLNSASLDVFDRIAQLREEGIETYGTADAGPNVFAITKPGDAAAVAKAFAPFTRDGDAKILFPGRGAHLVDTDQVRAGTGEQP